MLTFASLLKTPPQRMVLTKEKNTGKSCTTSSLGILQDGNVAKVLGCSGAM